MSVKCSKRLCSSNRRYTQHVFRRKMVELRFSVDFSTVAVSKLTKFQLTFITIAHLSARWMNKRRTRARLAHHTHCKFMYFFVSTTLMLSNIACANIHCFYCLSHVLCAPAIQQRSFCEHFQYKFWCLFCFRFVLITNSFTKSNLCIFYACISCAPAACL